MKIRFGLSGVEISEVTEEIEGFMDDVEEKALEVVRRLCAEGVNIAKMKISDMEAIYTTRLLESIDWHFNEATGVGVIHTGDTWYAAFVEFGTGIVGRGSPHPLAVQHGWQYDVNEHGEKGWYYPTQDPNLIKWTAPDGNTYGWTKGFVSRPFFYETVKELEQICEQVAKEVFRGD